MDSVTILVPVLLKLSLFLVVLDMVVGQKDFIREVYIHPLRNSSLQCYFCYNGDKTNDCVAMSNASNIPVLRCKWKETFCKVRRLHTKGDLTTFDRRCASECTPGCMKGIINEECISCCNTTLCNTDNGKANIIHNARSLIWTTALAWTGFYYVLFSR